MDRQRKYTIKQLVDATPYGERGKVIQELCAHTGISYPMLRKIWSYRLDDSNEAKPSQLLAIADYFGVDIYDLLAQVPATEKA